MILNNSDDTLWQFVDASRHGGTHIHTVQSPTPLLAASSETDAKVNDVIGARVISFFFFSVRFNFNALICEIMAADCNIVISRRIK